MDKAQQGLYSIQGFGTSDGDIHPVVCRFTDRKGAFRVNCPDLSGVQFSGRESHIRLVVPRGCFNPELGPLRIQVSLARLTEGSGPNDRLNPQPRLVR